MFWHRVDNHVGSAVILTDRVCLMFDQSHMGGHGSKVQGNFDFRAIWNLPHTHTPTPQDKRSVAPVVWPRRLCSHASHFLQKKPARTPVTFKEAAQPYVSGTAICFRNTNILVEMSICARLSIPLMLQSSSSATRISRAGARHMTLQRVISSPICDNTHLLRPLSACSPHEQSFYKREFI